MITLLIILTGTFLVASYLWENPSLKIISFILACLCVIGALSGCASLRYQLGYHEGMKDYRMAVRNGRIRNGYGTGYINGMMLQKFIEGR